MTAVTHINATPGCERPAGCRVKGVGLCPRCARRQAAAAGVELPPPAPTPHIVRIELTAKRRRQLADLAREVGTTADELASRLLSDLLDDDAKAHRSESESSSAERARLYEHNRAGEKHD